MEESRQADIIFTGGRIYSAENPETPAEAMAVKGEKICFLGSRAGGKEWTGPDTRIISLEGKMLMPGFIDAHAHPVEGGIAMLREVDLSGKARPEEYLRRIAEFALAHPGEKIIRGGGWSNHHFGAEGPRAGMLDALGLDKPVVMRAEDCHSLWVNSRALELAGITRKTPDPPGGVIQRIPGTGDPSGTIRESAMDLVERHLPPRTREDYREGILAYQAMANSLGYTGVLDARVRKRDRAALEAISQLDREEKLTLWIRASLQAEPDRGPEQLEWIRKEQALRRGKRFKADAVKIFLDGVAEGQTAWLKEPYAHRPGWRGEPLWEPGRLEAVCREAVRAGLQLHFHSIGNAAAGACMGVLEAVLPLGEGATGSRKDLRPLAAHLQLADEEDLDRMARLGAVAVTNPYWFFVDDFFWNIEVPFLGMERAAGNG